MAPNVGMFPRSKLIVERQVVLGTVKLCIELLRLAGEHVVFCAFHHQSGASDILHAGY
jgi:hypothetical protein